MASSGAGTGWAQRRQQARSLEKHTETLFHSYSQYASIPQRLTPQPTEEERRLEEEIDDHLDKREEVVGQLSRILDSESALTSSAVKQNNLAQHREILRDHREEFARIKDAIVKARNRINLLSDVQSDINAYRPSSPADSEAEYMLEERDHLNNSHNVINGVLSQAYSINESFGIQRETMGRINQRILGAASRIPGVNVLMSKISAKKRRDAIILGVFIGICFLLVWWLR